MKSGPSEHLQKTINLMTSGAIASLLEGLEGEAFLTKFRELSNMPQPLIDESVSVTPLTVAGCPAEWIVPEGADEDARILMIHGGAFIVMGLNSHRNTSVQLAKYTGCAVLAIDYRLAPEHPYPAALNDCIGAYEYIINNGPSGPAPASDVFLMGDSAGGNLSAALMIRLKDEGKRMPDGAILMSPTTNLNMDYDSWTSNEATDIVLGANSVLSNANSERRDNPSQTPYLQGHDTHDPYVSPVFGDLSGLPPIIIFTGTLERLRDDNIAYAEKIRKAGGQCRLEMFDYVMHAWTTFNPVIPESDIALRRMGRFVKFERYKKVAAKRFEGFLDLSDAMAENAARWPDHPAVKDGARTLTWAEFDKELNKMANALIARGIKPNDKVAALARNSMEYMIVMFGTLRAGACIVPLSGMAAGDSLAMMMDNSDSKIFFLAGQYRELIDPVKDQLTGVIDDGFIGFDFSDDDWSAYEDFTKDAADTHPGVEITEDLGFNIIYSSGTTGVPKGILHARRMRAREYPAGASTGYSPWCRTLVSTPLYSNTTMAALLPTMANGGCAVMMAKFNAEEYLQLAEDEEITHAMLVPVQYQRLLDVENFADYDLSNFQMKYSTSAPLREDLKRRVITEWPGGLIEYYGLTEGGIGCVLLAHMFPHKLHTVGFPMPGNHLIIVGEDGKEVPRGQPGEIYGRSERMMDGYFKAKEKTDEASWYDEDGNRWQRSGDMARFDEDRFVELLDRKKDMIISGGFNVFAADLEAVMIKHDDVNDVAVIAVPSEQWGETPLAIVEPVPDTSPEADALLKWANDQLGKGQRISKVELMDDLPRSTIGKVLKRELREPYWAHLDKRVG